MQENCRDYKEVQKLKMTELGLPVPEVTVLARRVSLCGGSKSPRGVELSSHAAEKERRWAD